MRRVEPVQHLLDSVSISRRFTGCRELKIKRIHEDILRLRYPVVHIVWKVELDSLTSELCEKLY